MHNLATVLVFHSWPSVRGGTTAPSSKVFDMVAANALLVTRNDALLEELLRLAAAAGARLEVAHDSGAALRAWRSATTVLVGDDLLGELADRRPVRREQVHVVGFGPTPDGLFRAALRIGAEHVIELPAADDWMVELLTDVADGGGRAAVTIGVVGGSGGIGSTTLAAAIAVSAGGAGRRVLLVDADRLGCGIDQLVGLDETDGVRWDSLGKAGGRFSSRSLREALPGKGNLAVLTWAAGPAGDLDAAAVREVMSAAQRGNDVVVVDLPRQPDLISSEIASRCDHIVLIAGLTVPAVSAASRVSAALRDLGRPVHLVTRGSPAALPAEQVAAALGLPLIAAVPEQRRLAESVELGQGPVSSRRAPLAKAARTILSALVDPEAS